MKETKKTVTFEPGQRELIERRLYQLAVDRAELQHSLEKNKAQIDLLVELTGLPVPEITELPSPPAQHLYRPAPPTNSPTPTL